MPEGAPAGPPTDDAEFERRLALLASLGSLDAAVAALVPDSDRERLRRLALPRLFDRTLALKLLEEGSGAPPVPPGDDLFARVTAFTAVEAVPRLPGFYRLRADIREQYLREWDSGTAEPGDARERAHERAVTYAALQERLVEHLRSQGAGWEEEELYHLLAADPIAARPLFTRLYEDAEARFDLTCCYRLLDALEERERDAGAWAGDELSARRLRLQARALTSEEYYRTSRYYERPALRHALDALMDGSAPWILELHALGGMGKTHFLRWAVARYCVPNGVPVARIDFDYFPQQDAGEAPWQFVGRLARALADQLASSALVDMARRAGEYEDVLASRGPATSPRGALGPEGEQFLREFAQAVRPGPVLLILDTMEEARARGLINVPAVLQWLTYLHECHPGMRLVLAGRFTLAEHFPGTRAALGGAVSSVELAPFTDGEAREYLRRVRGVTDDAMVEAMVRKGTGVPFLLALLADIYAANPDIGAEEIGRRDVGVQYLIERVLKRVPQYEVRWLLRYGVVPRKLTRAFIAEVMLPFLRRAMTGDRAFDDPAIDEVDRDLAGDPIWRRDRAPAPADALWDALVQYSGGSSWIGWSRTEPDTLVVHPVAAAPMRAVLRPQRVARLLHEAAVRHFAELAATDGVQRARWYREELFHRAQLDPARAAARWRELMTAAGDDAGLRYALASELVTHAAGAGLGATAWPGPHLHAEAQLGVARACLDRVAAARGPAALGLLSEARAAFTAVRALEGAARRPLVPTVQAAFVEARLLQDTDPAGALRVVRDALASAGDRATAMELEGLAGDLSQAGRLPGGAAHYRAAVGHARATGHPARAVDLRERLARYEAEFDRIRAALISCKAAVAEARRHAPDRLPGLLVLFATLRLRYGAPAGALATLDDITGEPPAAVSVSATLVRVRALLELRRPTDALAELETAARAVAAFRRAPSTDDGRRGAELEAELREAEGRVYGALLDYGRALDALDAARGLWRELGGAEHADRCLQRQIELQLREVGNLRHAQQLLEKADRPDSAVGDEAGIAFTALRAEWHDRAGDGERARALVDDAIAAFGDPLSGSLRGPRLPRALARLALEGLARRHAPTPGVYLQHLQRALAAVDAAPARLALLATAARAAPVPAADNGVATALTLLVQQPLGGRWTVGRLTHPDPALLDLRAVELHRVLGDAAVARTVLLGVAVRLAGEPSTFFARELLRAADRLGKVPAGMVLLDSRDERFVGEFVGYPGLLGAYLLERARRRIVAGDRAGAATALDEAAPLLERAESLQTATQAQLAELRAELAPREGPLSRAYYLRRAHDLYDALGDGPERERLAMALTQELAVAPPTAVPAGIAPASAASSPPPEGEDRRTLGLRVDPADERVTITAPAAFAGQASWCSLRDAWPAATGRLFGAPARAGGASKVLLALVEPLLENEDGVDLEVLFPDGVLERALDVDDAGRGNGRVRLDLGSAELHAVPWEVLLRYGGRRLISSDFVRAVYRGAPAPAAVGARVRFAQQALTVLGEASLIADGINGAVTQNALRNYQRVHTLPPTARADDATLAALRAALREGRGAPVAVTVVQPSAAHERRAYRDVQRRAPAIELFYARRGFAVDVIEDPDPGQIERRLRARPPAVLHVCAALEHSPTLGGSILDFANIDRAQRSSPAPASERAPVTAAALDRALQTLPAGAPAPLVVLDVPRPPTLIDTARQLLLRNAFAGELHLLNAAAAVLAIGFGEPALTPETYDALAAGLTEALSFGELAAALQRLGQRGVAATHGGGAAACVALYAAAPEAAPLPAAHPGLALPGLPNRPVFVT